MTKRFEADYIVIGAGAMSVAFVDTILDETDADVVIVDRYDKPGGHWRVAYEHVRLHQSSTFYGVNSTDLGSLAVDSAGYNAGMVALASGDEIRSYYERVMDDRFIPSGRVTYLPNTEYLGDGRATGTLSGEEIELVARKRIVDGTYMNVEVPSVTPPPFEVADGVDVVAPNGLARIDSAPDNYAVLGGGKTGIDAVLFLLDRGVDPDRISWVIPRDSWMFNRAVSQPGPEFVEQADHYAQVLFGSWLEASSVDDLWDRLAAGGYMFRLSDEVRPSVFKCATVTQIEVDAVRQVRDIVRLGRVQRIDAEGIALEQGRHNLGGRTLYVNCTANGLARREAVPVFSDGRISLQAVVFCQQVYSAAFIAHIEATMSDDATKNTLTNPVPHPETETDFLRCYLGNFRSELLWADDPAIVQWRQDSRLAGLTTTVGTPMPPAGPEREAALESFRELVRALIGRTEVLLEAEATVKA